MLAKSRCLLDGKTVHYAVDVQTGARLRTVDAWLTILHGRTVEARDHNGDLIGTVQLEQAERYFKVNWPVRIEAIGARE